jgi:hypothetical protein
MPADEDPLRALQWLATQNHLHPGATFGGPDVMRALAWSEQRAKEALRRLEEDGCITVRRLDLPGRAYARGHLEVSFKGRMRLSQPVARARRGVLLARRPMRL